MHIESRELVRMRDYLSLIVSDSTGQPYDRVRGNVICSLLLCAAGSPALHLKLHAYVYACMGWFCVLCPVVCMSCEQTVLCMLSDALLPCIATCDYVTCIGELSASMRKQCNMCCLNAAYMLQVIRELSRNKWMDPKQAIEYGMIDKVLTTPMPKMPSMAPKFRFERPASGEGDLVL